MKKNEKKMIFILIAVAIVIITIVVIATRPKDKNMQNADNSSSATDAPQENKEVEKYVQVQEDGSKLNISSKLNSKKTFNGLEISDVKFSMSGGQTYFTATVKNNTGKDLPVTGANIIILDEAGNKITTIGAIINETKAGETSQITSSTTLDFANAYDYTLEIY